jgi:hypothetical protein
MPVRRRGRDAPGVAAMALIAAGDADPHSSTLYRGGHRRD